MGGTVIDDLDKIFHGIRNDLHVLIGNVQLIERSELEPGLKGLVDEVHGAADRLQTKIDNLRTRLKDS